jgi:hypothetical protein
MMKWKGFGRKKSWTIVRWHFSTSLDGQRHTINLGWPGFGTKFEPGTSLTLDTSADLYIVTFSNCWLYLSPLTFLLLQPKM